MNDQTTTAPPGSAPLGGSALFVGGANDGEQMAVEYLPIIRLPLPTELQRSFNRLETEDYRKERLRSAERIFTIYVSQCISTETALSLMIAHYRPKGDLGLKVELERAKDDRNKAAMAERQKWFPILELQSKKIQKAIELLQWMHDNCIAPDITAHDAVNTCRICRLITELKAPNSEVSHTADGK